ncbi:MAG: hypothetical protein U1E65_29710 [Myxococcota bacterium]
MRLSRSNVRVAKSLWIQGLALLFTGVAPTLGCGGGPCNVAENHLEGSVSELSLDLDVDKVRVRKVDTDTVAIEFKHGNDFVAKVTVDIRSYKKGAAIPLSDGQVKRITSPDTQYPTTLVHGEVTFDSELRVGADAAGCFNVLFQFDDGTQRTLLGGFRAPLEDLTI